jgi:hypothetical protein
MSFEWISKHADTVLILSAIISSMLWMNGKFNEIEKDIAIVKTVLIMKNIMPTELAHQE